jgi:flagellar biosynthesis GTPase FlhF
MRLYAFRKTMVVIEVLSIIAAAHVFAQGAMNSLGVNEEEAKRQMVSSLNYNRVPSHLAARAFKAADAALRPKLVLGALAWIRSYTESPAFKTDYDKQRESARPTPPKQKESIESELAKQKAERQKGLEDMRKNLVKMPPDVRKSMEATAKQMEEMYAKQDADPKMAAMMRQGLEMQRAADEKSYQERLSEFEKRYPADPRILIAQRLQGFLDLSKDVDFDAKLYAAERGKMKFVNSAHESKPDNWKLCYRAGKPALEAARSFAALWLKGLQAK